MLFYTNILSVLDGVSGRIANFKTTSGTDADIDQLLTMRKNIVNYVHVIDIYAPCIVKSNIWNNDATMKQYCGENADNFQNYVLSISDEAFLLVVLINYTATWMSEIAAEHRKVNCHLLLLNGLAYHVTYTLCLQITCAAMPTHAPDVKLDAPLKLVVSIAYYVLAFATLYAT